MKERVYNGIRPPRRARIRGLLTDPTVEVTGVITAHHVDLVTGELTLEIDMESAVSAAERITAEAVPTDPGEGMGC